MRHFKSVIFFLVLVFVLVASADSWAALTGPGSISYGSGLYALDDKWTDPATRLSWNVFQLSNGNYEYDYTFVLLNDAKNISHVILQVSSNFSAADMLSGTTPGGILGTWDGQGQSNPGIPAPLYGIKWNMSGNVTSFVWSIVTDRAPMMGNFYAKDGNASGGTYAYSGTLGLFGNNVVVPDSVVVPIPGAAWLLSSGLASMIGIRGRKKFFSQKFNLSFIKA
ncbi:MAG TPA: hypothetical protein VMV04_15150 [Thermodesulfobacteriota bacterium]|nr:hypothetical protein [Thermodesulfobacteriota bacterium]